MAVYRSTPTRTRITRWCERHVERLLITAAALAVAALIAHTVISLGYPTAQP